MENIGPGTLPSAVSDKTATNSVYRMDPDVIEIIVIIFSLYFSSFRSPEQVTSFPSSMS